MKQKTSDKAPFYVALGRVVGSERTYGLRYFRAQAAAEVDASLVPGAYVVQTTPGLIWRSTRPAE